MDEVKKLKFRMRVLELVFLVLVGALFNLAAISQNGGLMPVYSSTDYSGPRHFSFSDPSEVNAFYLTDIIKIGYFYVSIGDIVMVLAAFVLFLVVGKRTYYGIKSKLQRWYAA